VDTSQSTTKDSESAGPDPDGMKGALSLDDGVGGAGSDTALVVRVAAHPDVAIHAPCGAPRVLD